VTLVEFEYMMDLAEAILRGAYLRTETRGSHFRTDFSKRDDVDWLKHTLAAYSEKGAVFSYRAVNVDKYKPQERKY
jgi:succinate dehydrogenase / fumarate reductase flavoprotein subunit